MTDLLAEALELYGAGYCPIRARTDGSKAPLGSWEPYQSRRPSEAEVRSWFANGYAGIGVVMGAVSGNAELLEFEGRAVTEGTFAAWCGLMSASGLGDLMTRLLTGYLDGTPGGGLHIHYRIAGMDVPGNTKLARRPATEVELAENLDDRVKVLIETRGKGGFVVTAPSNGSTHPTGRPWIRKAGGPVSTPVVTVSEHEALMVVCRAFDRMPKAEPSKVVSGKPGAAGSPSGEPALFQDPSSGDDRPGDAFNARTTWPELLEPHGWTQVYRSGDTTYWRRPGKSLGISATTGYGDGDYLYVFSTSTVFEAERSYDRFGAYAFLEHGGDHTAAARQLVAAAQPALAPLDITGLYLSVTELSSLPQPPSLIHNVLDGGSLFAITGRDGIYKSFLALDWLACLATGKDWHGARVEPHRVLYVVGEGVYGLEVRVTAWCTAWGRQIHPEWFTIRREPLNLFRGGPAFDELCGRIHEQGYGVILFDTLQRMSSGADTDKAKDASVIMTRLDQLRKATGQGAVGVVAHTGKSDNDTRGSSAFEDDLDIVWKIQGNDSDDDITVELTKRKNGPGGFRHRLRPRLVGGTGSLILEPARGVPSTGGRTPKHAVKILELLAAPTGSEGLSTSSLGESIGVRGGAVNTPVNWLINAGLVRQIKSGTRVRYELTLAGKERLALVKD